MHDTLEELAHPGSIASSDVSDTFQQLSEQDFKALQILFDEFNMSEIEPDLLRSSESVSLPEPEWFSLAI
jgi:hypothetical protein